MKLTAALIISLVGLVSVVFPVSAQESPASGSAQTPRDGSLSVSPAYIEISLTKPSEEQTIPFKYTNNSNQPLTIEMFPLDFNHADADGTIGFLAQNSGSYSYSLASYLSLSSNQLQIDPKQSVVFDVVVKNRPDLTPGGHYGAVVAKIVSGIPGKSGASEVAPSLSSLIFLRKTGGERYNLSLKQTGENGNVDFRYPKQIQLEFQNEGNVHLVPYGTVEITDMFGRILRRGVLNTSSFLVLPESRRNIVVDLQAAAWSFPVSFNTLTVRGNDSLKKTTFLYRNSSFYINPWLLSGGMLIIIFIGLYRKLKIIKYTKVEQKEPKKKSHRTKS